LNLAVEFADRHVETVRTFFERIDANAGILVDNIRKLAEISAPTFQEEKRTIYLKKAFEEAGLDDVHVLEKGSVLGYSRARTENDTLLLAAHIDHVFPEGTDLTVRFDGDLMLGPGTGDNAANVAGLIILARLLGESGIAPVRNIAFCGTVREEGNGNLEGIGEVMNSLGDRLGSVIAVDGGSSAVVNRSLAVRRYLLSVECSGGHSWGKFGNPSAIHVAASIITALDSIEVPEEPKTTYNVGTIRGGSSVNAIARKCTAEIDLRSIELACLTRLEGEFLKIIDDACAEDVDVKVKLIGDRPAASLEERHPLLQAVVDSADYLGFDVKLSASSTDAALPLSRGIPAVSFGIYRGGKGHTTDEFVEISSLIIGMKRLALAVLIQAGVKERA